MSLQELSETADQLRVKLIQGNEQPIIDGTMLLQKCRREDNSPGITPQLDFGRDRETDPPQAIK